MPKVSSMKIKVEWPFGSIKVTSKTPKTRIIPHKEQKEDPIKPPMPESPEMRAPRNTQGMLKYGKKNR